MQWISVKNRMPEENKEEACKAFNILILANNNRYYTGYSTTEYSNTHFYQHSGRRISGVTHWMPLPEPPKNI